MAVVAVMVAVGRKVTKVAAVPARRVKPTGAKCIVRVCGDSVIAGGVPILDVRLTDAGLRTVFKLDRYADLLTLMMDTVSS